MKKSVLLKAALPLGAAALFAAGCVVYPDQPVAVGAEVDVGDPPALVVEDQPVCPGPGFIWIGGSWAWHGRWTWERGRWDRPPHAGAVWVANRTVIRHGRHVYVHGGWR